MQSILSRFTSRIVTLAKKAVVGEPEAALRRGRGRYADWVVVALQGLREYLDFTYRMLLDVLRERPKVVDALGLTMDELPHFTTGCARWQQLKMPIWRVLLRLSADFHDTGEIQAIDATGYDRHAASQHFANRTDYTSRVVKTTALIDCQTGAILDIH